MNVRIEPVGADDPGPENLNMGQKLLASIVESITVEEWATGNPRKRIIVPANMTRSRAKYALTMAVKNSKYIVSTWDHGKDQRVFYVEIKKR